MDMAKGASRGRSLEPRNEEGREFLQHRTAVFWLVVVALGLFGATSQAVTAAEGVRSAAFVLMIATTAMAAVVWVIARYRAPSVNVLRALEIVGLTVIVLMMPAMGRLLTSDLIAGAGNQALEGNAGALYGDVVSLAQQMMSSKIVLGLVLMFVARAAVIPSAPTYIVTTTTLLGVPVVWTSAFGWAPFVADAALGGRGSDSGEMMVFWDAVTWWMMLVAISGVVSTVVYGLRRRVTAARRLGQYAVERQIGEGGMGTVYEAQHALMRRPTAIKVLPLERNSETDLVRFEREVRLTARLTHPNTVTIFDYGRTFDGQFYYAMELLEGASLDRIVGEAGELPAGRVIDVLVGVAGALEEAHGVGLIHRDVKPQNIMLCRQGGRLDVPKLLDFGLVKELQTNASLTHPNAIAGTPSYMAPEAFTDPETVDERSDLYSLGAVGYYLLTGRNVFDGRTAVEVCGHHLHSIPCPPSLCTDADVPPDLEAVILSCLAKEPDQRPRSARDLIDRLSTCESAGSWTRCAAEQFWHAHADIMVGGRPSGHASPDTRTLAIDVTRVSGRRSDSAHLNETARR